MSTEKASLNEGHPLPNGVKLRKRKFGANPTTSLSTVTLTNGPFRIHWEDPSLHLHAVMSEEPETHRLRAEVYCSDPAMMDKASVSVGLVGRREQKMIRKTIKLSQPDQRTGGCLGTEDFGLLQDAIRDLGDELGMVVFMLL